MKRVERLLERQIFLLEQRLDPPPISYCSNQGTASQRQLSLLDPLPWTEVDLGHPGFSYAKLAGIVLVDRKGYERFIPRFIDADGEVANELIEPIPASPVSSNFPFSDESPASRQGLLQALPPFRQCDELKDVFFEAFTPVCLYELSPFASSIPCIRSKHASRVEGTHRPGQDVHLSSQTLV